MTVAKRSLLLKLLLFALPIVSTSPSSAADVARLIGVQKVWDAAPHNAFTDLIRFNDAFYLAFREGPTHGVPGTGQSGGNLRVLRSEDGINWASTALIAGGLNRDLRDAKLGVTPDNRLMLVGASAPHESPSSRQSQVWFSGDGTAWSDAADIGDPNWWLWGIEWHEGNVYSIGYGPTTDKVNPRTARLYKSEDGVDFHAHVPTLTAQGASEGSLLFRDDGTAVALIRRDSFSRHAVVGTSEGDFTDWTWHDTGMRFEGPDLIELPNGKIVAGGRSYSGTAFRTSLHYLDPTSGTLTEFLVLPSGGADNSYPGMVWHNDQLWISYYSSHEGKSSIYVAQVDFVDPLPIRHTGDRHSLQEGWSLQHGGISIASNGPVNDSGVLAWNIHDSSSAGGSREAWTRSLTSEQLALTSDVGWRYKGRVRVLANNDVPDGAIELSVFLNSDRGYVLWLGSDANGNALVSEYGGVSGQDIGIKRTATVGGGSYHDYEMVFDPATQAVDVFVNGQLVFANLQPADLQGNVLNRIAWGSNASSGQGNANYSFVDFVIVEGDFDGDGRVDGADFLNWQRNFPYLNAVDLAAWKANYGKETGLDKAARMVPEPSSLRLVILTALVLSKSFTTQFAAFL